VGAVIDVLVEGTFGFAFAADEGDEINVHE